MGANPVSSPLPNSREEFARLSIQSGAWQPAAERLFDEIGVGEGWRCIDLGCGPAGVLDPLGRRVGDRGLVVGLDVAPGYLTSGAGRNVQLVRGDVFAAPDLGTFDLTHARFLFAPVGRPTDLLGRMISLTRAGGVVAAQEPDSRSWKLFPRSAVFERLIELIVGAFTAAGSDFDAGARLGGWFRDAGLVGVKTRSSALLLSAGDPYLRMPLQMARSLRPKILGYELSSSRELARLLHFCERDFARRVGVSFTLAQAWGSRR